jgi:LacI family transcriptional regulator, galactose operon repressor
VLRLPQLQESPVKAKMFKRLSQFRVKTEPSNSMARSSNRSRPTLQDVARKAGVSAATVSYVLNGTGSVGRDVQKLVQDAAKSIRYRVNFAARATRTGQTHSIGLILPDLNNPFFPEMAQVVQAAARHAGYAVFLVDSEGDTDIERSGAEDLISRGVEGIVWFPASEQDVLAEYRDDVPIVVVDRPLPDYDTVSSDYDAGGVALAKHVIASGHERIGMVVGPQTLSSAEQRRGGFVRTICQSGQIVWEVENDFSIKLSDQTRRQLDDDSVTVIVCGNDLIAIGVMRALHEQGRRVPDDVSVVGFDDIPWAGYSIPGLATVRQPFGALGKQAADLLIRRISGDDSPLVSLKLGMRLVPRGSLALVK